MIEWQWCSFAELSGAQLYEVLAQRQQVFILEQTCLYPDIDGYDLDAHHLLCVLVAYLRCLAPGAKYDEMSLGRILTTNDVRGSGAGRELVAHGLQYAEQLHPGHRIRIGAQQRLKQFYQSLGFETVSAPYDEDGILHIDMLR